MTKKNKTLLEYLFLFPFLLLLMTGILVGMAISPFVFGIKIGINLSEDFWDWKVD